MCPNIHKIPYGYTIIYLVSRADSLPTCAEKGSGDRAYIDSLHSPRNMGSDTLCVLHMQWGVFLW